MRKLKIFTLTSFYLLAPFSYSFEKCEEAQNYLNYLTEKITKQEKAEKYLTTLGKGNVLDSSTKITPDFLFSVDLGDEKAISRKKASLEEMVLKKNWPLEDKSRLIELCESLKQDVLSLEKKLKDKYLSNAGLKISFFTFERQKRDALLKNLLINSAEITQGLEQKTDAIESKLEESEERRSNIGLSKSEIQEELKSSSTRESMSIKEALIAVETYREKIASLSTTWFQDLKLVLVKYESISKQIDSVEKAILNTENIENEELIVLFEKINRQWRTLMDGAFAVYRMYSDKSELIEFPNRPPVILRTSSGNIDRDKFDRIYLLAQKERDEFLSSQKDKVTEKFNDFYNLLSRSSRLRSELLSAIDSRNVSLLAVNEFYFRDLIKEILVIPFKFSGILFQKYLDIKTNLSKGFVGIWNIIKIVFSVIFIFFIPFVARTFTRYIRDYLDQYRANLVKRRGRVSKNGVFVAFWIQRLTPYVPWLLYVTILGYFNSKLFGTALEEVAIIVPIIRYIIVYKMFRLLVSDALSSLKNISRLERSDAPSLVDSTSKFVGFFFLVSYITLYLTKITVDEGLLFRLVSSVVGVLGFLVCAVAAFWWRGYLAPASETLLEGRLGNFLAEKCKGRLSLFFSLPALIVVLVKILLDTVWNWLSEFEFSKKFLAKLYRKKIEALAGDEQTTVGLKLPHEYEELFAADRELPSDQVVNANSKAYDILKREIDAWNTGKEDDHCAAIYGDKGIGKTTFLDKLEKEFSELNIVRIKVPPKVYKKEKLNSLLSTSLGYENSDNLVKNILNYNDKLEKNTLILVDDAHNLFLGQYNGFEALNAYIDIVNLKADKIFWVSAFNATSWAFIKGVLGAFQYLRTEVFLDGWSDESVKNLILNRHNSSEFKLYWSGLSFQVPQSLKLSVMSEDNSCFCPRILLKKFEMAA